MLINGGKTQI